METTVLDVPLDTQSYIKTIIATHYDRSKIVNQNGSTTRPWGKDNLAYLYTLFEKDVPREDYALASVLLQEYVSTVTAEHFDNAGDLGNFKTSSSDKKRKQKRSSKDKSPRDGRKSRHSRSEIDWKAIDPWSLKD